MKNIKRLLISSLIVFLGLSAQVYGFTDDFERGKQAFKSSNYGLAVQYFRRALRSSPKDPTVRYYLAQSLVKTKQLNPAQIEFQRVIQAAPYSQEAKYAKVALVQINDYINNSITPKWRPVNSNLELGVTETKSIANVGENYIDKVTEKGNVIRWQTSGMPLKVYIESKPKKTDSFDPALIVAAKKGLENWQNASNGKISVRYVGSPESADIKVFWKTMLDSKLGGSEVGTAYTAGVTTPEYSDKELTAMTIILTTTDPNGKPHKPEEVQKVSAHEFGHALGIMGHSTDPGDLMFPSSESDGTLSKRDINTINLLYGLEPDISNFRSSLDGALLANAGKKGKKGSLLNEDVLGSKDDRLKREVEEAEEAMKNNPKSDISHINLGNIYGNKGDYDGAIREFKTAIKLNPKNDVAYSNLASMYQNQGKSYDALKAYNEAKRLNPQKPKPYLDSAIVSFKLNQKADSITSLREYVRLNPKGKQEQDVQNLAKQLQITL